MNQGSKVVRRGEGGRGERLVLQVFYFLEIIETREEGGIS